MNDLAGDLNDETQVAPGQPVGERRDSVERGIGVANEIGMASGFCRPVSKMLRLT